MTLLAASASFRGIVPLDARTNQPLVGHDASLVFPLTAILFEPFLAAADALVGAPDYRVAVVSTLCWFLIGASGLHYWQARVMTRRLIRLVTAFGRTLGSALAFALYGAFVIMCPMPSWSLVGTGSATAVADLHSHSILSHDGPASIQQM
jgi:hypothetical protein